MSSLNVFTSVFTSPVGELHLYATHEGLLKLTLPGADLEQVEEEIGRKINGVVEHGGYHELETATQQLAEYFAGTRRAFALELDRSLSTGFALTVHQHLQSIPYGATQSYGEVAKALGKPGAARAAGTACGKNPLPIIVPCHRVLSNDGGIGGYASDIELKRHLLALEGHSYF